MTRTGAPVDPAHDRAQSSARLAPGEPSMPTTIG
jgi:hypothetical protein